MIRSFILISFFILSVKSHGQESYSQHGNTQSSLEESKQNYTATPADIISSLEAPVVVTKIKKPPMITGSAELGFLYKTGDTNSGDVKTGLDLRFEKGQWRSLLDVDLLLKKADQKDESGNEHFKTTDQKWTLSSQTNYSLDNEEKNYIYGNFWYEENEFSSFENQSSLSTGWGRHWYKNKDSSLWGDIGPGYKRDLFKASESTPKHTSDTFIVQVQALYIRKIGEHIELKQHFSLKQALDKHENSIYKAVTSVTTKLISTMQLKFNFTLNYNSKVEANKENLETQTAVTLVYSF